MSILSDLQAAQARIKNPDSFGTDLLQVVDWDAGTDALKSAIQAAITLPGPPGSPAAILEQSQDCKTAAARYQQVADDIHEVASGKLPSLWQGATADLAARAIAKVGTEIAALQQPLQQAAAVLQQWSVNLAMTQSSDRSGKETLSQALSMINSDGFIAAVTDDNSGIQTSAVDGIGLRISAVEQAQSLAKEYSAALEKLVAQINAVKVSPPGNDAMLPGQLAALTGPNGKLLTPTQIARANARLEAMSPADQAAFDRMLAATKSPLEAGYLWQALGAGTSMAGMKSFAAAIGPHGADTKWLQEHLTPNMSVDSYLGASFTQGDIDDCVPASTIMAQASVDPVLMLSLTTGGTANGPDTGSDFTNRLQNMYLNQYVQGQKADGVANPDWLSTKGVGPAGQTLLANQDLGSVTGSHYQYQSVDSSAARADVLGQINQAVSSGKPVPIGVTNGKLGHQMMIIGQSNGRLQIYNPWGHTTWVTDSQFVNGQLGALTNSSVSSTAPPGGLPTPDSVELPR